MHQTLSDILGREVVGELVLVDGVLCDGAWGRLLLGHPTREEVDEVLDRLQQQRELTVRVVQPLVLERGEASRGFVEVEITTQELPGPYWLQLTCAPLIALYEQRFWLDASTLADLMGCYVHGLRVLRGAGAEPAFARLARLDDLEERFGAAVDGALGGRQEPEQLPSLIEGLRRAVRLLPWLRRKALNVRWVPQLAPAGFAKPERIDCASWRSAKTTAGLNMTAATVRILTKSRGSCSSASPRRTYR